MPEKTWTVQEALVTWGKYGQFCRPFAERVKGLDGVKGVAATFYDDYADV